MNTQPLHVHAFLAAHAACEYLKKIGASVQESVIMPGGQPLVRCDYSPVLERLRPDATGRTAQCVHQRAETHGATVVWDEPASVSRARTLKRILGRGR